MCNIYVDDLRPTPAGFIRFYNVKDCVAFIRRMYKAGNTDFYISLDHDAGDYANQGGDYIEILKQLEAMRYGGHFKHAHITCHFHSMNVVGIQNMRTIVNANPTWMEEA